MATGGLVCSRVTVKVPATSANLGSGYDCIGMALDLWNELTVETSSAFSMMIEGEGATEIPRNSSNYVVQGLEIAFKQVGLEVPPLSYFCKNAIPFGNGLGSSSAAIVSGLLAGLVLTGQELKVKGQEELIQLAAQVEGHIDNIAPCIYGGLQIGVHIGDRWDTHAVDFPRELQCILFIPDGTMNTEVARQMLPDKIDREDAIYNIARVALLVKAFSTNNLDLLEQATKDKLHQPVRGRKEIMPALFPCINAALRAGAKGACLSGAGSTIIAFSSGLCGDSLAQSSSERSDHSVASAMSSAAHGVGVKGKVVITRPAALGAHVVSVVKVTSSSPSALQTPSSTSPTLDVAKSMRYRSTRSSGPGSSDVSFEGAIMRGLAPDGGLFVPTEIPTISDDDMRRWRNLEFTSLAVEIMSKFINPAEIPRSALDRLVTKSYASFNSTHVTPLIKLSPDGSTYVLEQFHGPTCAFKDVALQFLGNLFEYFLETKNASVPEGEKTHITVLGATSGDTGSAAIEGLRGKNFVQVYILHPKDRVAPIQEAQMTTVLDENIHNISVEGSFDDCQTMVKTLFNDEEFRKKHGLAAINSINWARIMAQIVYYFYAYFRLLDDVGSASTPKVNFVVPTGNFGNALAGFYARKMGLPINKMIVATNRNDILYRFLSNADYSARPVEPSLAPAMDIVIPSNFERFLFALFDNDCATLASKMADIKTKGVMEMGVEKEAYMAKIKEIFETGRASDDEIRAVVAEYKKNYKYFLCPHTGAGVHVLHLLEKTPNSEVNDAKNICFATAHPGKFEADINDCNMYQPTVPVQLRGLLEKETRCRHITHDITALIDLMDTDRVARERVTIAEAAQRKTNVAGDDGVTRESSSCGVVGLVSPFVAGAVCAFIAMKLLQR
eukprot:m.235598 g.235598  ORF g.235598 m.235598 type:complete len:897 (-) comp33666_c4_seq1:45-2735(-)